MNKMGKRVLLLALILVALVLLPMQGALAVSTEAALREAISAGGTVTLKSNIELTAGIEIPAGKSVTLDLNGFVLSGVSTAAESSAVITNRGTLTIKDSGSNGKITAMAQNPDTQDVPSYANNTITNCGTLTLESGTVENATTGENARACFPIDNNSTSGDAIINIKGGTVTGRGAIRQYANSTTHKNEVNITKGTVIGTSYGIWVQNPKGNNGNTKAELNVDGGDVAKILISPSSDFDISIEGGNIAEVAIWEADTTDESRNPSGFITGGTFEKEPDSAFLKDSSAALAEITVGGTTSKIYNADYIQTAIANGGTLKLLEDVTLSKKLSVTADLVIEGNGKTLTYTGSDRAIDVPNTCTADLTIKNLTVDFTSGYSERGINYNTSGSMKLDNVKVNGTNVTYAVNMLASANGANVTITDSSLTGKIALNVWGKNCTINVTDTSLTSVDKTAAESYSAVVLNNNGSISAEGTTITITGGSISVEDDSTVYSNATKTGVINISNSTTMNGKEFKPVAVVKYVGYDQFYSCETLQDAVDTAEAGGKVDCIQLIKNITLDKPVVVNKQLKIELNGCTVTGDIVLNDKDASITSEGLRVKSGVEGYAMYYEGGVYFLKEGYTVTYMADGKMIAEIPVAAGQDVGSVPAVPEKEGYTGAWDHDGKNITKNLTINAVYTIKQYTVTFDANGGTGEMAAATVNHGEYVLPECAFTAPEGKQFAVWDIDGSTIPAGQKISVTDALTLVAVWEDILVDALKSEIVVQGVDAIPENVLKNMPEKVNSVEKIVEYMQKVAVENGHETKDVKVFDVNLVYYTEEGEEIVATEETFPVTGIDVYLDLPEGTNAQDYEFFVTHMFTVDSERLGTEAGTVETPKVTIVTDANGKQQIHVKLNGLSPVSVAWKVKEDIPVADLPETGDHSNLLFFAGMLMLSAAGLMVCRRKREN